LSSSSVTRGKCILAAPLAPDVQALVSRLEPRLGAAAGPPVELEGGITNRNYRVRLGGTDYVVRCPSRNTEALGIRRAAERAANEAAAALGAAPRVAAYLETEGCVVTEFVPGRELTAADLEDAGILGAIARALRAIHDGPEIPGTFDALGVARGYAERVRAAGGEVPEGYAEAEEAVGRVASALAGAPEHEARPCHNDLLPANFIWDGARVLIIDWEYAGMGDRWFDLANLAVNCELSPAAEEDLLEAYWGAPADRRRLASLRLMKPASDFREAMWGVLQAALAPAGGSFDYAAYGREHLERALAGLRDPGFEGLLETARGD
jgi:thiamine kinase-like enzyme